MHLKLISKFIIAITLVLNTTSVFAYTSPGKATGYVNDFAKVITADRKTSIESKLQSLKEKTGVEVAVVTVSSLGDETVESYAVKLFEEWGIGNKTKDNGLLILVAPNEREVRIEVGYGLEGDVTDLQSGNVVRKAMIPYFSKGDFPGGIESGVDAISEIILKAPGYESYSESESSSIKSAFSDAPIQVILFVIFIIANLFAKILGKSKSWWLGGVIGFIVGSIIGLVIATILGGIISVIICTLVGLIFDYIVSKHPNGPGGGGWPMFFGGGSSGHGGGFGGFGGGSSGGGGASGRW